MLGTVRIQGGDTAATNIDTGIEEWVSHKQFTHAASFLCKMAVFVPTATAANVFIYLIDLAAAVMPSPGDASMVLVCPPGFTTTLDFSDYGKIFTNGIFLVVASNEPIGPGDPPSEMANNSALVALDYRLK